MKPSLALILSLFLAAAAYLGCGNSDRNRPRDAIFLSGRIEGDETNLAPKGSGRIAEVTVREGEAVRAGQVLVRLESEQTLAQRAEAEASLRSAQRRVEAARLQVEVLGERQRQIGLQEDQAGLDAQGRVSQAEGERAVARADLARAQAELEQNRADAKRYRELAEKGAVAVQLAEQFATKVKTSEALLQAASERLAAAEGGLRIAQSALKNAAIRSAEKAATERQIAEAKSQVRLAESEAVKAEAALRKVQADVSDLEITAPFDGTVITRAAEPGQVVAAGTTLLTMVDLSRLYLRGFVPEGQIGEVIVGQSAEVYLDSDPETALPAEVMRVDPEAMFTPENTYFQQDRVKQVVGVKLALKGGYGKAKLGMPADGLILTGSHAESP